MKLALLLVFLIGENYAFSQSKGASVFVGNIVRHREFLTFDQPTYTQGIELEYIAKKDTSIAWQRFWRMPDIGHHLHIHNFRNDQLGRAIAYYPSVSFNLWSKGSWKAQCQMGNGISYLTKKYEFFNKENNAIGSHWNSTLALRFQLSYVAPNNLEFTLGPQFFHYSNGAARAPNAGINTASLIFGVKHLSNEIPKYSKGTRYRPSPNFDRWKLELNVGLGFRQINIPNGLTFRVPQVSIFAHYYVLEYFRIVAGFSYQYNYADYYFQKTQFETNEVAAREARDYLGKISGDFLFGNFFARFQFGFYIPIEEKIFNDPFSTMFSLNYGRKILPNSETKLFFGVGVRSHKFVAQYLSINTGFIL